MLLLAVAAEIGERQDNHRKARRGGLFGYRGGRGLCLRGDADSKRINPDRLGDVLQLGRAEIADREIEPALHLTIGVLGKADRARLANALQPRRDVDAVPHQIAVGLLDDITEVNADAKFDALSSATPALRSTMACCTSSAQRTASTTLRNSMTLPSPVRLTMRP
jgi:hypothetical protein